MIFFLTIFISNVVDQTKFYKMTIQGVIYETTVNQFGIAKFWTKRETIHDIAKPKETK